MSFLGSLMAVFAFDDVDGKTSNDDDDDEVANLFDIHYYLIASIVAQQG